MTEATRSPSALLPELLKKAPKPLHWPSVALELARHPEALMYRAEIQAEKRALNVYCVQNYADYAAAYWGCPMEGGSLVDLFVFEDVVYPAKDPTLCGRCRHQLACTLNGGPIGTSFEAVT